MICPCLDFGNDFDLSVVLPMTSLTWKSSNDLTSWHRGTQSCSPAMCHFLTLLWPMVVACLLFCLIITTNRLQVMMWQQHHHSQRQSSLNWDVSQACKMLRGTLSWWCPASESSGHRQDHKDKCYSTVHWVPSWTSQLSHLAHFQWQYFHST